MDYKFIVKRYYEGKELQHFKFYSYSLDNGILHLCKWNSNDKGWVYALLKVEKESMPPDLVYHLSYPES